MDIRIRFTPLSGEILNVINLITKLLQRKEKPQGCIVVMGDDIQSLSEAFVQQQYKLHVYQVIHNTTQARMQVHSQVLGCTIISLNLNRQSALKRLIEYIQDAEHVIELCVVQPTFAIPSQTKILSVRQVEQQWQNTGLMCVNVAQEMIRQMLMRRRGTVIFLGLQTVVMAHDEILEQSLFASIQALSQSLAREFQPKGIHVSYCMLEQWDTQHQILMQSVQQLCWHIYQQPKSAWSQVLSV